MNTRPPTSPHVLLRCLLRLGLSCAAVGLVLSPSPSRAVESQKPAPGLTDVSSAAAEVGRLGVEYGRLAAAQQKEEAVAAREAADIERMKEAAPNVATDLELPERLARAQARATALSQKAATLQRLLVQLRLARQRLVVICDRALGDGAALSAAQRLDILRTRALQVEALTEPDRDLPVAARSAALATEEARSDDPVALKERADLLRDSADKVRRELGRLAQRAEELSRRRHLRERAALVDEDLFAEQVSGRRIDNRGRQADTATSGAAAPAAPTPGTPAVLGGPPTQSPGQPNGTFGGTSSGTTAPRLGLDPATLDLLRKSDDTADPEVKLQAMRRAQGELSRLADQLSSRAASLERRADELRKRK